MPRGSAAQLRAEALGARGLARVQERLLGPSDAELDLEGCVQRLDSAFRAREASLDDAADAPALLRQLLGGRQVDARDLEEPDLLAAGGDVVPYCRDEAVEQRRPQHGVLSGERLRQPQRVRIGIRRDEARRIRLAEAAAHEDVLAEPA